MISSKLLTKYILMPTYFRLLIFIIIYFIIQQLFYLSNESAFCMQASGPPAPSREGMAKWFGGRYDVSPETGNVHMNITKLNPTNATLTLMDHEERIHQIKHTIIPAIRNSIADTPNIVDTRIQAQVPPLIAEAKESVRSILSTEFAERIQSERTARIADITRISQELGESNNRITTIQNFFEQKLAEKDQIISSLKREHDGLEQQVLRLERAYDRDIASLQRQINEIRERRNAQIIDDINVNTSP